MDVVNNIEVNFRIMKEPRGFIRIIQFVLSILAFATICTSATAKINFACPDNTTTGVLSVRYSYPFNLHDITLTKPCTADTPIQPFKTLSFAPAAQFFCFVGVMSFLLCIAYVIGYIVLSPLFSNGSRGAMIDFIFTAVWAVIWFIASVAWADKLNSMGTYLSPSSLIGDIGSDCETPAVASLCTAGEAGNHGTLVVSVLFGFLNMLVWIASLWFLFKETSWHKENAGDTERFDQPQAAVEGETPTRGAGGTGGYQTKDPATY